MATKLGRLCERIIEAGWLLAVLVTPAFFNIYTNRSFEPDKVVLLRSIVTLMAAAAAVKGVEWVLYRLTRRVGLMPRPEAALEERASSGWSRRMRGVLMGLAALFALNYLLSAWFSVAPRVSLLGSYQRLQGTYTSLCFITLALLVAAVLRTRAQLGRLVGAAVLGSLPVVLYGIAQHFGVDPLPWGGETAAQVTSTLGNSIFLGAYLIMVIPLTLAAVLGLAGAAVKGVWGTVRRIGRRFAPLGVARLAGIALLLFGCVILLALQGACLYFTRAPGPWLGLLAAGVLFTLLLISALLARSPRKTPRLASTLLLGLVGLALFGLAGTSALFSFSGFPDEQVLPLPPVSERDVEGATRPLIWQGARELISTRPSPGIQPDRWQALRKSVGYGPETMWFAYLKVFPPELAHYEGSASPDRAFNRWLDLGVNLGWVGVGAYLLLVGAFLAVGLWTIARTRTFALQVALVGLLAAAVAHFVEGLFGIDIAATRLLFWMCLGAVAALPALLPSRAAGPGEDEPTLVPGDLAGEALTSSPSWSGLAATLSLVWLSGAVLTLMLLTLARDLIGLALGAAMGVLWLAGIIGTSVIHRVDRWSRERTAELGWWLSIYPIALGVLLGYALLVLVVALGMVVGLVAIEGSQTVSKGMAVSVDARFAAIFSWLVVALLGMAFALRRDPVPFVPWSWRNLVVFLVASPAYAVLVGAALVLILLTNVPPVRADAFHKQAASYETRGHWERAADLYERAIAVAPYEDFHYLALGRAYLESAKGAPSPAQREEFLAQSQETLERAYALSPLSADHPANLARLHRAWADLDPATRQQHLDQALGYYEEATTIAPHNAKLLGEFGDAYLAIRQLDEAEQIYSQVLELDDTLVRAHSILGYIYAQRGEVDQAIAENLEVLKLVPDDYDSHKNLAILYHRQGRLAEALAEARIALPLAPAADHAMLEGFISQLESELDE